MNSIVVTNNKTLKLLNIFVTVFEMQETKDLIKSIVKMDAYINTKKAQPIGPLIHYFNPIIDDKNEVHVKNKLMRQMTTYIDNIDPPYKMESKIRVPNCMYCRYTGPEDKLKFAYDKILLTAFEEDIPLKGDSYTIFVDRDEENETIIADVFMERADNE